MKENTIENLDIKDPKVYELGYLLLPLIAEEEKNNIIEKDINSIIKSSNGEVLGGKEPEMIKLAYTIRKMIDNKYQKFSDAYFGSVKFEVTPDEVKKIDEAVKRSDNVLRYILIESSKTEEVEPVEENSKPTEEPADKKEKEEVKTEDADQKDEEVKDQSDNNIDKEIDDLLTS